MRRERDSNSRTSFAGHTLSRRASSATRASLLFMCAFLSVTMRFALFGHKVTFFFLYNNSFCTKSFASSAFFVVFVAYLRVHTSKYALCIVVCDEFRLFFFYIIYTCYFPKHFDDVRALVPFASIGYGGKVRGIGFEHDSLQRDCGEDFG